MRAGKLTTAPASGAQIVASSRYSRRPATGQLRAAMHSPRAAGQVQGPFARGHTFTGMSWKRRSVAAMAGTNAGSASSRGCRGACAQPGARAGMHQGQVMLGEVRSRAASFEHSACSLATRTR